MFPVSILKEGMTIESLPPGNQYVVARDGVYFYQREGLVGSLTKINDIPSLAPVKSHATLWMPPLPNNLASLALSFFRKVFRDMASECELQIYVSTKEERFLLICPEQLVGPSHVHYKRQTTDTVPESFLRVGTIHSHCDFGAFHSGTDTKDEETEDGLHITFGNVNQPSISIAASIAVRKERFTMDPLSVIEGITKVSSKRYTGFVPDDNEDDQIQQWMGQVKCGVTRWKP